MESGRFLSQEMNCMCRKWVSKVEKYIEALKGISYFEWIKLREGMDNEFNRLIGESKRKLELTDVERVEKTIRSQFGA